MFDEARQQLTDALATNNAALPLADAEAAIDGGSLMVEQVIKQYTQTEEQGDTTYVTAMLDEDGQVEASFPIEDAGSEDQQTDEDTDDQQEEQADAEAAEADAEPTEDAVDPSDDDIAARAARGAEGDEDAADTYEVNGLRIDVDPTRLLAGTPTGDDIYGAPKLHNDHPKVPETTVPYHPVTPDGITRDTEALFFRSLARELPIILEGEAGTGKNQLVRSAGTRLNLPTYRQEFGVDTTVFDMVGEKDLHPDGGTYYILGKAAKAAMFGGVYVADEIAMATGSVTSYLHPLFEDRGSRELELRGTGRTLRDLPEGVDWDPSEHLGRYIHPNFYAVGTTNPLGYADVQEMNDALRSRCMVIEHPYLAEHEDDTGGIEDEAQLLADETDCDPDDVFQLVRCAAVIRESREEQNTPQTPLGHRELRDTVELAGPSEDFMSYAEAARIKMVGQAQLPKDKDFIRDTIEDEL